MNVRINCLECCCGGDDDAKFSPALDINNNNHNVTNRQHKLSAPPTRARLALITADNVKCTLTTIAVAGTVT